MTSRYIKNIKKFHEGFALDWTTSGLRWEWGGNAGTPQKMFLSENMIFRGFRLSLRIPRYFGILEGVEWPISQADYNGSKQQCLVKDFPIYYVINKVGSSHVFLQSAI